MAFSRILFNTRPISSLCGYQPFRQPPNALRSGILKCKSDQRGVRWLSSKSNSELDTKISEVSDKKKDEKVSSSVPNAQTFPELSEFASRKVDPTFWFVVGEVAKAALAWATKDALERIFRRHEPSKILSVQIQHVEDVIGLELTRDEMRRMRGNIDEIERLLRQYVNSNSDRELLKSARDKVGTVVSQLRTYATYEDGKYGPFAHQSYILAANLQITIHQEFFNISSEGEREQFLKNVLDFIEDIRNDLDPFTGIGSFHLTWKNWSNNRFTDIVDHGPSPEYPDGYFTWKFKGDSFDGSKQRLMNHKESEWKKVHETEVKTSEECLKRLISLKMKMKNIPQRPIKIKSVYNGKYVRAQGGGGGVLFADRSYAGDHERFSLISLSGNKVALRTNDLDFITAINGGGGTIYDENPSVIANRSDVFAWETFDPQENGNRQYNFQCSNPRYYLGIAIDDSGFIGATENNTDRDDPRNKFEIEED